MDVCIQNLKALHGGNFYYTVLCPALKRAKAKSGGVSSLFLLVYHNEVYDNI